MRELEILKKPLVWPILSLILVWVAILRLPDQKLHLVFCDVGQGDAILLYQGSNQILIDGGSNQDVLTCLSNHLPFWDRKIEMVIATHPEADHITGLIDVINRYNVSQFVVNSAGKETGVFREFKEAVLDEEAPIYFPKAGDKLKIGSLELATLWPREHLGGAENTSEVNRSRSQENTSEVSKAAQILGATTVEHDVNETSIVLRLSYGSFDALFPGDISTKTEALLDLSETEVLKVAHHGSKYSTSENFLEQTMPELAVISVGKNPWGHPTEEVIERISELGISLLRTDQEGEIEIISDGKGWGVRR